MTTLNFDLTLGPFFWGTVIVFIIPHTAERRLYGVTTAQTAFFFRSKLGDKGTFKALILFLWYVGSTHHFLHTKFDLYRGLVASIVATVTSDLIDLRSEDMASYVAHWLSEDSFRLQFDYAVSGRSWPLLAAVTRLVRNPVDADEYSLDSDWNRAKLKLFESLPSLSWLMYTSLGAAVMADTAIAGSLCVLLWKRRTSFSRTNSLVSSLMVYSIQTGLFTCCPRRECLSAHDLTSHYASSVVPSRYILQGSRVGRDVGRSVEYAEPYGAVLGSIFATIRPSHLGDGILLYLGRLTPSIIKTERSESLAFGVEPILRAA
ncbi:hypothetical protein GLOTRDRAFT_92857 [Gloeophyllum trabeum ATCC 11539]|uniref:DUF6534 domain-containing protein n=1 Tax=Gloeophyllum trabeum (strain ATCC 11539 / FP-39264 / Madison 617) TaxID=670483 RepID=S7Q8S3_GLOTA|nr:uncharacterized protein GLOTRDRAFT_92857 [Gloeophyllum trabeum ATCC 11539]EPQ56381.1 hypothetical protein GLOTRDRAFT_92857 [Gloeophyllum trabeum ATCC 11539]